MAVMDVLRLCIGTFRERVHVEFFTTGSRLFWLYLLSALGLALAVFLWQESRKERPRFSRVLRFLFPQAIWLHRSAVNDYLFVFLNGILLASCVVPWALTGHMIGGFVGQFWHWLLGPNSGAGMQPWAANVCYTVILFIVGDFASFAVHWSLHRFPILWQFHKVHHSSEVLTPFSALRQHPVESYLVLTALALAIGLVTGTFNYFQPMTVTKCTILGVNVGVFLYNIFGANLHHSHVWLSFGPVLERIVISPAQHQIHHSADRKHFDKNFGVVFACWDWMFGSLYLTGARENLTFGLGSNENREFRSLWGMYRYPVEQARRMMFRPTPHPTPPAEKEEGPSK